MMQHKDVDFLVEYSCRLSRIAAVTRVSLIAYLYICLMALNCAIDIILMRKFQTGVRFHYSVSGLQQMRDQIKCINRQKRIWGN